MSLLRGRPLVAGVLLLVLAAVVAFAAPRYATAPVRVVIDATPITSFDDRDPSRVRFGDLEFRGGLALEFETPGLRRYLGSPCGTGRQPIHRGYR